MAEERYLTFLGQGGHKLVHWEHWSNPDAETYLTGIDYYDHPRLCRQRLAELYPMLRLSIPDTDTPKPRPADTYVDEQGNRRPVVRWGDDVTAPWVHGEAFFKSAEDVFAYSPLEHTDCRGKRYLVEMLDFSSEEAIYQQMRKRYPAEWGDNAPEGSAVSAGFYNTTFMWPLLTFGWELFLECCLDARFERIMDEFAMINRRVFAAIARLPVNFVTCHDDICNTRGLVCSPKWMRRYVYPRYEEYWGMLKAAGKRVIYMGDGNVSPAVDDIMACGALGVISEPYTDYKSIARKYQDCFLAGEGDNRILHTADRGRIAQMVASMVDTARMSRGYMMCIGNHIPWNVSPEGIKMYLDLSAEMAYR